MPDIPFEIVKVTAAAGGQYGPVEGKIKGDVAAGIQLSADLCHGIQLGVAGQIAGMVEGKGSALFVGAQLKGEASAAAGAKVLVRLEPNLFDKMGLSIDAGAFARAGVAGSVAIYLTPEYFARFVNDHFDDFTADLFLIFLEEVYAEIGVWGRAAFSAMAEGHINLILDIQNLDAGFETSAGFNVGLEAGCGWDMYCKAGFRNLRRAVLRSSLRISQEVEKQIAGAALPQAKYLAMGFDFTLPLVSLIALDLGQASYTKRSLLSDEEVASIVMDNFVQNLQRFSIDRIVESAISRLTDLFADLYYRISGIDLDDVIENLEIEIRALIKILEKGRIEGSDIANIIERVINIVDLIDGGFFDPMKQPLTIFWIGSMLSLQAKSLLDEFYADANLGSTVLGSVGTTAVSNILPNASEFEFVKEEVRRVIGPDVMEVDVAVSIDYLIEIGVSDLLELHAPDFVQFRDLLSTSFGLSEGDLVADLLNLLKGQGTLQNLKSYEAFKNFVKQELIDGLLVSDLIPQLKAEINDETFVTYLTEVAEPSLLIVSEFVFSKLDTILVSNVTTPMSPTSRLRLMKGLSSGCGVVVYNVIARNILFFDQMVTDFLLDNLSQNFRMMRGWLDDPNHPFFQSCIMVARQGLPGAPNISQHIEAFRVLMFDIVLALEQLSGPAVYTQDRRTKLTQLKREIMLSTGGSRQFKSGSLIEQAIAEMIECNIPDLQRQKIEELTELMLAISIDSLEIIAERLIPSVIDFYLKLTLNEFSNMRRNLLNLIAEWRDAFLTALSDYRDASEAFDREIIEALAQLNQKLTELRIQLEAHMAGDWESLLQARIRAIGEQNIREQNLEPEAEEAALVAFNTVEWLVIKPAVDLVVIAIREQLSNFVDTLDGFTESSTDAVTKFLTFKKAIEAIALGSLANLVIEASDGATAVIETLFPAYVETMINEYLQKRAEQKQLELDKQNREAELAFLHDGQQEAHDQYQAVAHRSDLRVEILNPGPDLELVYPASTEITIILRHFTPAMLFGAGKRLQLMLNASVLTIEPEDIEYNSNRQSAIFKKILPPGLLAAGLNLIEVSWIYGDTRAETRRQTVPFIVNAETYYPSEDFELTMNYNPAGYDIDSEYVEIGWHGGQALDMSGWLLKDKANHRYYFPELILKSGDSVRVYTGGQGEDDTLDPSLSLKQLHMGRGKAVWNNEGDTVLLIKNDGELVYSETYLGINP